MNNVDFDKIRKVAEDYYRNGDFYCSEAVVKTIRDEFKIEVSDDAIAMASGFPVGIGGSGCTCGAITGGIMALGMVFGRKKAKDPAVAKSMELSKKLHDDFKKEHKSLCCRFLTKDMELGSKEHMDQCIAFTGEVAERVARIIVENR
ncbi:C_GCAxxG_C_C family protein [Clostridium sporogenes]|uniref:C-GCAxxG-C-C family protein n=1 Tax=Clostridium botulinum TaxID=1491 RepID=UPI0007175967|nr:C-GCAxxG-C-C family protein [Clostridium botulinum]KRU26781.1 C_GCAxxG_C_C family protein [Clostridium sporogenes]KRU29645.1 C_GCAxxG_C_C family protein [Clostridium sporogenes]KRU35410.1 C_GCAxxG_C_C family protein [Clostridium sporogenes]KRU49635.1 C_GCAxxG_C_C family protein [Clostridium sporogenes]MBZ1328468.1 C-GCAxxG-C-C family protein [Clostridium botulinum]